MKNKFVGVLFSLGLAVAAMLPISSMSVSANTLSGGDDWKVEFTEDEKMESNFKTSNMDDTISGMQPGDDAIFTVSLQNDNDITTDWYMSNKVLKSLEDDSKNHGTAGGAYTYYLEYTAADGTKSVLFDSERLGGTSAAGTGLHQATDALGDFFYLDTLPKGKGGYVTLRVVLDGETQNNDYQDTLAELQMNFAVMMRAAGEYYDEGGRKTPPRIVKTGDDKNMTPFFIISAVAAAVLVGLAVTGVITRKKEQKEGAAV